MMSHPINITFTLGGLFKFVYSVSGIVILAYVFLILRYIYQILKGYSELFSRNAENFDSLIKDSSNIVNKLNIVTDKVPESAMNAVGGLKDSLSLAQTALSMLFGLSKKRNNN